MFGPCAVNSTVGRVSFIIEYPESTSRKSRFECVIILSASVDGITATVPPSLPGRAAWNTSFEVKIVIPIAPSSSLTTRNAPLPSAPMAESRMT